MLLLLLFISLSLCAIPLAYNAPPIPPNNNVDLIPNPYGPKLPPIAIAHECCEGVRNGPEVVYYPAPAPVNPPPCVAITTTATIYAQPITNVVYVTQPPSYITQFLTQTIPTTILSYVTTTQSIPIYYTMISTQTVVNNVLITSTETRTVTDTVYVPQAVQPPPLMIQQQAAVPVMPPMLVKSDGNTMPLPNIGNPGGGNQSPGQQPNLGQQMGNKLDNNPFNRPPGSSNQPLIVQQAPSQPVMVQEAPHQVIIQ